MKLILLKGDDDGDNSRKCAVIICVMTLNRKPKISVCPWAEWLHLCAACFFFVSLVSAGTKALNSLVCWWFKNLCRQTQWGLSLELESSMIKKSINSNRTINEAKCC